MSASLVAFESQLGPVDQLIAIHARIQTGRGRRHQQDALHHAGVVLTVAAWQAYVEKVVKEALQAIEDDLAAANPPSPRWALHSFLMRKSHILNILKKFNTPNDQNVRGIFQESLGFDPWPSWAWNRHGRNWSAAVTRTRTNGWVLVRHSVAHGFELPPDLPWLRQNAASAPRLTLGLLEECKRHFRFLANQTDAALAMHLNSQHQLAVAW